MTDDIRPVYEDVLSLLVFSTCSSLALGACASHATAPEDDGTAFSAVVVEVLTAPVAPGTVTRILVVHPGQPEPVDRSIVHISAATTIVKRTRSGDLVPATIGDVRAGRTARFNIENVELQSYPRQVFATRVEL